MNFPVRLPNVLEFVTIALYCTAMVYALLGLYALRRRARGDASLYLAGLLLAMAWWSAGYGLEIGFQEQAVKVFWGYMETPAVAFIPVLWLFFSLEFVGESALLTSRNKALAVIIPVLMILAEWTNGAHHLYYTEFHIETAGNLALFQYQFGPLFFLDLGYSYILLGIGSALLAIQMFRSHSLFRGQTVAMLLVVLPPWIANAVYTFGLFPIPNLDITPFAFLPAAIILTWAIARYKLLEIVPPTQNMILQGLQDGIVLLDGMNRILYVNRAAEEILGVTVGQALGQPAETVCSACAPLILPLLAGDENHAELSLNGPHSSRTLEVDITPNHFLKNNHRSKPLSYTLIFHDITQKKEAQAALKYREAILHAVELASESFLKSVAWKRNIPAVLERLGEAAEVSRVYVFERQLSENSLPLISQQYEWARAGIEPQIDNPALQNLEYVSAGYGRWEETLGNRGMISGPINKFPESERELLAQQGILSIVVVPVFVENKFWGFIGFDECTYERAWSEAELDALRAAADIFGAAITRGNIEQRLINRQRSQDLLHETLRAALSKSEINEMGQFLVNHLGSLIGADHCFLSLWDKPRGRIIPLAAYGLKEDTYRSMEIHEGETTLTASALKAGHTLIVEDTWDSPYVSQRITALFGTQSVLAIPMISNEEKLGAVLLGFMKPHHFTPEEIMLSEQATDLVTLTVAKFRAVEEARRRAEEAETLRRAGMVITETLNLQETTTRLLEQLAFILPHDSASVQLLRDGELEIVAGEGWTDPSTILGVRFPIPSDNPNTVVIETRKPYLLNEPADTYPVFRSTQHAMHIRSWLGVPLMVHNQVIGLLAIDSRTPNRFTPDDAQLAAAFASQVAVAIENARLFDEIERLAITDGLTGLYNRRHFLELAEKEFERATRFKRELSVMIFDIDHFKTVNDNYGHAGGDQALQALASLCRENLREADSIGRYGGEEFIAMIVEAPARIAYQVGERLRQAVEKMNTHTEDGDLHITISIGIAEINENTPNLQTLINRADQAMYVAKHKGRNRVIVGK